MSSADLSLVIGSLGPHVVAVGLCGARLLPIAFLCPLFGGQAVPTSVKLALVLTLALALHFSAGVGFTGLVSGPLELVVAGCRELVLGLAIGLIAGLPFDAARAGGRFIDTFRGTSAEAALPLVGTREAASGDLLHQVLVGLAVVGGVFPVLLRAVWRSFGLVSLGAPVETHAMASQVVSLAGTSLGTALAIGAPIAGVTMAVDGLIAVASRAAPQMSLPEVGVPLRILGGGAALWLGLGLIADRLLLEANAASGAIAALAGAKP